MAVDNSSVNPTPEQIQTAKKATDDIVNKQKEIQETVKNDKVGVDTLSAAIEQLQDITAVAKADNDKDESADDSDKADKGDKGVGGDKDPSAKSVWQTFREAMKEIGKFSDNFLKSLKDAPITSKTRKDISDKLKAYKDLLQLTQVELQKQRQKAKKLSNTFDNLIFFILPDAKVVKEALAQIADNNEKQRMVSRQ